MSLMPLLHQIFGIFLLLTGAVLLPLPIPLGLPMLTIGFALLAPYVPAVQRLIRRLRTKSPSLNQTLLRHRRRFPPIIRRTIAKTHPKQQAPAAAE